MRIHKSDGTTTTFKGEKLERALRRAKVSPELTKETVEHITRMIRPGTSTQEIHTRTLHYLEQRDIPSAARYNLKHAMFQLGPSGYPFEHYVAQLMEAYGWQTEVGVHMQGRCIMHEVDVLGKREGDKKRAVEAKYHQRSGARTDVKVALYIHSRHEDLVALDSDLVGVLITNTEFTTDAIAYGECVGMRMKAWNYPEDDGLAKYIDNKDLYPVSVFSQIPKHTVAKLARDGIVLASQLCNMSPKQAKRYGLGEQHFMKLRTHAEELCGTRQHP